MFKNTTMDYVKELLLKNSDKLIKITFSVPIKKDAKYSKITVESKTGKSGKFFQITYFYETKVKHENIGTVEQLWENIELLSIYKQWDIKLRDKNVNIFINKNKTVKIRDEKSENQEKSTAHDKEKNYALKENIPLDWLIKLGIMNESGKVLSDKRKKFRQINKFIETSSDILEALPNNAVILDIGCGKAYLTFALYHHLTINLKKQVRILGIDLKTDVLEYCSGLANELNFTGMLFQSTAIEDFTLETGRADLVVSLHACDTATDYALFNAVKWESKYIISVPCCQHELYGQIKNDLLSPMLKHGILKERFAAMLTDTLRVLALESYSYKCQIIEFIDIEHSAKNIMLKCEKGNHKKDTAKLKQLCESFAVSPKICELLIDKS